MNECIIYSVSNDEKAGLENESQVSEIDDIEYKIDNICNSELYDATKL